MSKKVCPLNLTSILRGGSNAHKTLMILVLVSDHHNSELPKLSTDGISPAVMLYIWSKIKQQYLKSQLQERKDTKEIGNEQ